MATVEALVGDQWYIDPETGEYARKQQIAPVPDDIASAYQRACALIT